MVLRARLEEPLKASPRRSHFPRQPPPAHCSPAPLTAGNAQLVCQSQYLGQGEPGDFPRRQRTAYLHIQQRRGGLEHGAGPGVGGQREDELGSQEPLCGAVTAGQQLPAHVQGGHRSSGREVPCPESGANYPCRRKPLRQPRCRGGEGVDGGGDQAGDEVGG